MPKYKTIEGAQAFSEKFAEICDMRRGIIADLVKRVAPIRMDQAMSKRKIGALVVKYYYENAQAVRVSNPFLIDHADSFISVKSVLNYWSDIKVLLAEEGLVTAWTHEGVFLTSDDNEILRCFGKERAIISGSVEHHNNRAEITAKINSVQVPVMAIQLLLAE